MALGTALKRGARVVTSREAPPACRLVRRAVITGMIATGVHVADLRVMPAAVTRHLLKTRGVRRRASTCARARPTRRRCRSRSSSRPASRPRARFLKEIEKHVSRQEFRRAACDGVGELRYPGAGGGELRAGPARLARRGGDPSARIPHRDRLLVLVGLARHAARARPRSGSRPSRRRRTSRERARCRDGARWRSRSAT